MLERTDIDFIIVSGIDYDNLGILQQGIPVLWSDVRAGLSLRVEIWLPHRHDFCFYFDFGSKKRGLLT